MCGIAGFMDKSINYNIDVINQAMGDALYLRGPDDFGAWKDKSCGVSLIHRRLSILDLSLSGHQPMISKSGKYIIVFNGEIYNWQKIKLELEAKIGYINWQGHSDTEVILMAVEVLGITDTLAKIEGMFAIAIWDKIERELYLIRDRIGEKPLYYGYLNGAFAFASELKVFKYHPKFNNEIECDAIGQLLLHSCIPAPLSIYKGIYKLLPGHYVKLKYTDYIKSTLPVSVPYWQLSNNLQKTEPLDKETAIANLDNLLKNVITEQIIADVPVGTFLSGGVDSSIVTAIAQSISKKNIKTFSIGFHHPKYNEANYSKEVAKHLDTNHTELYVSDKDALDVIPHLSNIYSEPFSDPSQIPTYLVAKLAKKDVTVCLSGDGGDELFCGYTRYRAASHAFSIAQMCPVPVLKLIKKALPIFGYGILNNLIKLCMLKSNIHDVSNKLDKLNFLLDTHKYEEFYLSSIGHWANYSDVVKQQNSNHSLWMRDNDITNNIMKMQYLDTLGYLPDDILVKVDRAAMANSLETRCPILNHKVVEFAFSLPKNYKLRNGSSKWLLRQVLYKYVPKHLIERPKAGFGVPLHDWLRDGLKEWADDLLSENKLNAHDYFNVAPIRKKWQEHLSGKANNAYYLWDVLMFQQWFANSKNI